eukprot:14055065-Ditylum_brightwellii.AAC.1
MQQNISHIAVQPIACRVQLTGNKVGVVGGMDEVVPYSITLSLLIQAICLICGRIMSMELEVMGLHITLLERKGVAKG